MRLGISIKEYRIRGIFIQECPVWDLIEGMFFK